MKRCRKCNKLLFPWNIKHKTESISRTKDGFKEGKICDECLRKMISEGLSDIDKQILMDIAESDSNK